MIPKRLAVLGIVVLLALPGVSRAQGTSGAQFLGIGMGARAAGMGGAYVSLADDATSLYWNPAGLSRLSGHSVTVSHVSWLDDAGYEFASYAMPLGRTGTVGLALEQGSISWDNTGEGEFEAGDFCGALAYGRRLSDRLGVGAAVKYVSSDLGDDGARTYAFDVGASYRLARSITLGLAVRNVGPGFAYVDEEDPLPATVAAGGSWIWKDLTVGVDLEKENDLAVAPRVGLEYRPLRGLALRGGFIGGEESALSALAGGVGVNWDNAWALDYAYRGSDLGGAHWVSLSAALGGEPETEQWTEGPADVALVESTIPKSNLTVLGELVGEAVDEALGRVGLPGASDVYLSQQGTGDASWLVQSIVLEKLTDLGHSVKTGGMPSVTEEEGRPAYEISYRIVSCEVSYPRAWREWLVGTKKVERRAQVDLHFQVLDVSRSIIWAGSARRERRDIVLGSRLPELATAGQAFTSPSAEPAGWDKVLEPLVVAGIVGGLIYLFYTSRTAD